MEAKREKGDRDFSFFRAGEILPPATGSLRMAPILRLQEIQERSGGEKMAKEEERERESSWKEEGTKKKERARFARRVGRTEQTDRSLIYGDHTSDI